MEACNRQWCRTSLKGNVSEWVSEVSCHRLVDTCLITNAMLQCSESSTLQFVLQTCGVETSALFLLLCVMSFLPLMPQKYYTTLVLILDTVHIGITILTGYHDIPGYRQYCPALPLAQ